MPTSYDAEGGGGVSYGRYRFDGIPIPTRIARQGAASPHDLGPGPYDDGGEATLVVVVRTGARGKGPVPPGARIATSP